VAPDLKSMDNVLRRHLPSAPRDGMDSDGVRVLGQLKESGRSLNFPVTAATQHAVFRKTWYFKTGLAIAAAIVLVAILSVPSVRDVISPRNAFAIVESVDGSVFRTDQGVTQTVAEGEKIVSGTPVRTSAGSHVVLKLDDGARIQVHPESQVSIERVQDGVRVLVSDGSVNVTPATQPEGNLYIQNQRGMVPVNAALFQSARGVEPVQREPRSAFEVVSIRRSAAPAGFRGGGGRGTAGAGNGPLVRPLSPCLRIGVQLDPSRFTAMRASVADLIAVAYGIQCHLPGMISGGPDWTLSDLYDIQALIPAGTTSYTQEELADGKAAKLQAMIQTLLSDRFRLLLQKDSKEMSGFNLTVINPSKLKLSPDQTGAAPSARPSDGLMLFFGNQTLSRFAIAVQGFMAKPVINKTGLSGLYDFYFPMPELAEPLPLGGSPVDFNNRVADLIPHKLEEYLGLKLEPGKVTVDTLIIEHVEKPSEN